LAQRVEWRGDLVYAGAGLGLLHALEMVRRGWRVLVCDRGEVGCAHREWNISRYELQAMVAGGSWSWDELQSVIMNEYADGMMAPPGAELAEGLKAFIQSGKSSLTAAQAIKLASGLSPGSFVASDEELSRTGDRLGVAVHYPDGAKQETNGLVVSTGNQPLVLVMNKNSRLQMIRQEPKSREQLTITAVLAAAR
jgi:hypothetical protein